MFGIIYRAYLGSKSYIGCTQKTLRRREGQHRKGALRRNKANQFEHLHKFAKALRKHDTKIVFELLYNDVPVALLPAMEAMVIAAYDSVATGYNTQECDWRTENGRKQWRERAAQFRHSSEARAKIKTAQVGRSSHPKQNSTRAKISASLSGKVYGPRSEEWRQAISKGSFGKKMSVEARAKMSQAKRAMSDETKRKMSESAKNRRDSDETRLKKRLAALGRKHSPETLEKLRASARLREKRKRDSRP